MSAQTLIESQNQAYEQEICLCVRQAAEREEALQLTEEKEKWISLTVRMVKGVLLITVENPYNAEVTQKLSNTTKFGLKMLERAALISAHAGANSACTFLYHDPKKPEALKALKKF